MMHFIYFIQVIASKTQTLFACWSLERNIILRLFICIQKYRECAVHYKVLAYMMLLPYIQRYKLGHIIVMHYDGNYNIFIVLDRSGCTRILRWCVHPDLRRRFLEQSECHHCLRFTPLPRPVSRCPAILQRTIAKSPATHNAAQTHRQTHRQKW